MSQRTPNNTALPRPLATLVRLHRWWCRRRAMRQADRAARQLSLILGEDNVAFVREVCLDITATTGVYVGPCEIVQAMLSAIHDAGIDFTDCESGYSDIKRAIRARMMPVSLPDTPIVVEAN